MTEVTYLGYVWGTLAALRRMMPRDEGSIVQVGSALAYRGIPFQSAYCAAKHAIQGFCDSLRSELLHEGSKVRLCMVQMPALNTPQFGWVKSRLPRKPQPVPPIFQPEMAASAIVWAAGHDRREIYVGWPTVKAILGDKIAPGFADRYLAKNGYESQQYDGLDDPHRLNNLWEPVPGDPGAHGAFDKRAKAHSLQLWANLHRGVLALVGIGVAGALWANLRRLRPTSRWPLAVYAPTNSRSFTCASAVWGWGLKLTIRSQTRVSLSPKMTTRSPARAISRDLTTASASP